MQQEDGCLQMQIDACSLLYIWSVIHNSNPYMLVKVADMCHVGSCENWNAAKYY